VGIIVETPRLNVIKDELDVYEYFGDLNLGFLANANGKFSPYLSLGLGTLYDFGSTIGASDEKLIPYWVFNAGLEYMISKKVALTGSAFVNQLFTDYYDGSKTGTYDDNIWGFKMGFKFYIK